MKTSFLILVCMITACGSQKNSGSTVSASIAKSSSPIYISGANAEALMGALGQIGARSLPGLNGEFIKVQDLKVTKLAGSPEKSTAVFTNSYEIGARRSRVVAGESVTKLISALANAGVEIHNRTAGSVAFESIACEARLPSAEVDRCTVNADEVN